jgi:hypothetical protein
MVSSSVTSEQIMSALRQVPAERWGELLRAIESLQAPNLSTSASHSPVRSGTDLKDSELIGIWSDRTDLGARHKFARGLRQQAEQRKDQ